MKIFRIGDKIVIEEGEQRKVVLTNVGHNKRKVVLIRPGETFYTALFEHFTQGLAGAPDTPVLFEAVFRHQVVGEAMAPDTTIGFQVGFAHAVVGISSAPDQPAIFEVAFTHNVQGLAGVPDGLVVFEAAFSQVVQGTAAAPDFVKFFDAGFSHYAAGTAAAADFSKLFNVAFAHFTEGVSAAPDVPAPPALLLDAYPGAAAAYSLRQLRTGVTNVVRLRRSSDNAEADFTALQITDGTLVSWVGAGNDGFITVMYNQAAVGGNNLTQTTTTKQVLLVQNGVLVMRGSNAAMFNDSIRDLRNTASINLSSGGSIYLAFETINDSSIHSVFGNRVDNSNRQFIGLASNTHVISSRVNAGGAGFIKSVGFTTFGKRLATYAQLDAANFNFKINNINSDGTQSPNVINAGGGVFLFTDGDALNRFNFQGYIFEVIIYDTNQSANDAAIESDINARYDIY